MEKRNSDQKPKVPELIIEQSNYSCWILKDLYETISFGEKFIKALPKAKLLLLQGDLGAGKTSLVKGIAKGLGIKEPITSPTFALAQHYLTGGRSPLIHLDLYRIENPNIANELFLQEEEQSKSMGALMVVEWPDRLSLPIPDAWRGKLKYSSKNQARFFQLIPPLDQDNKSSISSR